MPAAGLLVPVKAFSAAKARLTGALPDAHRAELARWMAGRVLAAAGSLPTFVVCDDDAVASWADEAGATVLWRPGLGLNAAVSDGVATLAHKGVERAVVAHSDLPLATDLDRFAVGGDTAVLVPDRRDDGTNVLSVPTDAGFTFAYGAGSFRQHEAEAARLGLSVRVVRDPALGHDVDTPADLAHPLVQEVLPAWLRTSRDSRR